MQRRKKNRCQRIFCENNTQIILAADFLHKNAAQRFIIFCSEMTSLGDIYVQIFSMKNTLT